MSPTARPTAFPTNDPTAFPTQFPSASPTTDLEGDTAFCARNPAESLCSSFSLCAWDERKGCIAAASNRGDTNPDNLGGSGGSNDWVFPVAIALASFGMLFSVLGYLFIMYHRKHPVIQLSQPLFLQLFCIGCAFLNASVIPQATQVMDVTSCTVQKWMFDLSFTFTFATLFLKLWRVWRIFSTPAMQSVRITNNQLLMGLLTICSIDAVILGAWTALPSLTIDESGACLVQDSRMIVNILSYVFIGVLVAFAVFVSCKTRTVGNTLGESKQIFFVVHNTLMLLLFNMVVGAVGIDREWSLVVLAACVTWGTCAAVFVILHAKWEKLDLTQNDILNQATMGRERSSRRLYQNSDTPSSARHVPVRLDQQANEPNRTNSSGSIKVDTAAANPQSSRRTGRFAWLPGMLFARRSQPADKDNTNTSQSSPVSSAKGPAFFQEGDLVTDPEQASTTVVVDSETASVQDVTSTGMPTNEETATQEGKLPKKQVSVRFSLPTQETAASNSEAADNFDRTASTHDEGLDDEYVPSNDSMLPPSSSYLRSPPPIVNGITEASLELDSQASESPPWAESVLQNVDDGYPITYV